MYEKFDRLLKERGITPYVVASYTGIAPSTLSDWKAGKYTPKLDKLVKIADYFKVPVTYFIEE